MQRGPVLSVAGDQFQLSGEPFDMWGIRTASATATDAQCEHLVAQLDEYRAHGVNTVTVFYTGCSGASYDPFSPDGCELDADAAANPALSVFFHNKPWCQSEDEPMRFDLGGVGTVGNPGIRWYFEAVREVHP